MQTQQMELTFNAAGSIRRAFHKPSRLARARWWFEQMHRAVDRALDWQPTAQPRPEQVRLELPRGQR